MDHKNFDTSRIPPLILPDPTETTEAGIAGRSIRSFHHAVEQILSVCKGEDLVDPYNAPDRVPGWERTLDRANLGTLLELKGRLKILRKLSEQAHRDPRRTPPTWPSWATIVNTGDRSSALTRIKKMCNPVGAPRKTYRTDHSRLVTNVMQGDNYSILNMIQLSTPPPP